MKVIDAVVSRGRADDLEDFAKQEGHRAVRLADGDRVVLRVTVEAGDPDDFISEIRDGLRRESEEWEHYATFEPSAIEPRNEEDDRQSEESVAGTDEVEGLAAEGATLSRSFLVLSVLSGVLAAAGLLRDSAAVLVGAMVLAPLFKPIAAIGVGVVLGQPSRAIKAFVLLARSLALASGAALVVTLLTAEVNGTALLSLRTGISPFDVVIALAAGVSMAYVIVRRDAMAMVGIVVAASLMPVAAAMGIAVALWRPDLIGGAAFTLSSNVGGVLLGFIVGLRFEQLRVTDSRREQVAQWVTRRSLIGGTVLMLLLTAFSVWTYIRASDKADEEAAVPEQIDGKPVVGTLQLEDGTRVLVVPDDETIEDKQMVIRAEGHGSTPSE